MLDRVAPASVAADEQLAIDALPEHVQEALRGAARRLPRRRRALRRRRPALRGDRRRRSACRSAPSAAASTGAGPASAHVLVEAERERPPSRSTRGSPSCSRRYLDGAVTDDERGAGRGLARAVAGGAGRARRRSRAVKAAARRPAAGRAARRVLRRRCSSEGSPRARRRPSSPLRPPPVRRRSPPARSRPPRPCVVVVGSAGDRDPAGRSRSPPVDDADDRRRRRRRRRAVRAAAARTARCDWAELPDGVRSHRRTAPRPGSTSPPIPAWPRVVVERDGVGLHAGQRATRRRRARRHRPSSCPGDGDEPGRPFRPSLRGRARRSVGCCARAPASSAVSCRSERVDGRSGGDGGAAALGDAAALPLGAAAPDAVVDAVLEGVLEARRLDRAGRADAAGDSTPAPSEGKKTAGG